MRLRLPGFLAAVAIILAGAFLIISSTASLPNYEKTLQENPMQRLAVADPAAR